MTVRAAIYARVSSAAQRDAHTIENQLRVLPAYVAAQGWELIDTYIDDGRSAKTGKLDKREGFTRLLADVAGRRFDVLVIVDVDRLTRSDDAQERASILGPLQRAGIDIVTPAGGRLDMRTLMGELYVTMQALFAAEENRKRAERIKAGKLRAIAEGRKPAGPTPYGLRYSRATGTWSIDEAAAAIVREIYRRVAGGEACQTIADDLARRGVPPARGEWTRAGVYRTVRWRTAVGEWKANKALDSVVRVPAIVTEEEWQAAQHALLRHRRRGLRRTRHVYLLEGLATCGACGAPIAIRSSCGAVGKKNKAAYVCRGRKRDQSCGARIVPTGETDELVWAALCDEIAQPDLLDAMAEVGRDRASDARDWQADAETHRAHLGRLEKVETAIMARFRRGQISEGAIDVELAALARERQAVRVQLATAERALGATLSAQDRLRNAGASLARLRSALPRATPEQRRALLRELVYDRGVTIIDGRARLDLRLLRSAEGASRGEAGARLALVAHPDCRTINEAIPDSALRIRRLA